MPTKIEHIQALSRVCRHFGGQLAVIAQQEFDNLFNRPKSTHIWKLDPTHNSEKLNVSTGAQDLWRPEHTHSSEELSVSPSTYAHGLWWRRKIIYAVRGRESVNGIIHEMGHVFAAPHHPDCACNECHEIKLAWLGNRISTSDRRYAHVVVPQWGLRS